MDDCKLTVLLVDRKPAFLEDTLTSVEAALAGLDTETIVLSEAMEDKIKETLLARFPRLTILPTGLNSYSILTPELLAQLRGEYVAVIQSGTIIGEDLFRTLCYWLDEHPNAGLTGLKLLDGHGAYLPESKKNVPGGWTRFCQLIGVYPTWGNDCFKELQTENIQVVDVPSEPFYIFRKEKVMSLPVATKKQLHYPEIVRLAIMMKEQGMKNRYMPERALYYKEGIPVYKAKRRRLLILCREAHFDKAKKVCVKGMPGLEYVNLWDLDSERLMDAICRKNQMKGFTDMAFCYPDVRYEQMLLFMEKLPNIKTLFHIFMLENGQLRSPY